MSARLSPRSQQRKGARRLAGYTPKNVKRQAGFQGIARLNAYEKTQGFKKRELMQLARNAGWRGKSYRTAKKFERKLGRALA